MKYWIISIWFQYFEYIEIVFQYIQNIEIILKYFNISIYFNIFNNFWNIELGGISIFQYIELNYWINSLFQYISIFQYSREILKYFIFFKILKSYWDISIFRDKLKMHVFSVYVHFRICSGSMRRLFFDRSPPYRFFAVCCRNGREANSEKMVWGKSDNICYLLLDFPHTFFRCLVLFRYSSKQRKNGMGEIR